MRSRRRLSRSHQGMFIVAVFFNLYAVCASAETIKPTEADVDLAIKACSVGGKSDKNVDIGLDLLKKRILSGKAGYSQSDIPSVIGSPVENEELKVKLFDEIQKCVIEKVYPPKIQYESAIWPTPSIPMENTETQAKKMHEKGKTTAAGYSNCFASPTVWNGRTGWHFVPGTASIDSNRNVLVCNNGYPNTGEEKIDSLTEDSICMTAGARTPDPDAIAHCIVVSKCVGFWRSIGTFACSKSHKASLKPLKISIKCGSSLQNTFDFTLKRNGNTGRIRYGRGATLAIRRYERLCFLRTAK